MIILVSSHSLYCMWGSMFPVFQDCFYDQPSRLTYFDMILSTTFTSFLHTLVYSTFTKMTFKLEIWDIPSRKTKYLWIQLPVYLTVKYALFKSMAHHSYGRQLYYHKCYPGYGFTTKVRSLGQSFSGGGIPNGGAKH